MAACHFPFSALWLNADTTQEGVWAVSAKSGLLMHGKAVVLRPSPDPGSGSAAGGSFLVDVPLPGSSLSALKTAVS